MKVAGVATKWKRNVAATQALNPLLSVALSRLSTLLAEEEILSGQAAPRLQTGTDEPQ
jgi:hypothetical protein